VRPASEAPALPEGEGLVVAVNPRSGTDDYDPAEDIQRLLPRAEVLELTEDAGVDRAARRGGASGRAKALGVAGGDGSVAAAAAVALEHGLPLAVIPAGHAQPLRPRRRPGDAAGHRGRRRLRLRRCGSTSPRSTGRRSSTPRASAPTRTMLVRRIARPLLARHVRLRGHRHPAQPAEPRVAGAGRSSRRSPSRPTSSCRCRCPGTSSSGSRSTPASRSAPAFRCSRSASCRASLGAGAGGQHRADDAGRAPLLGARRPDRSASGSSSTSSRTSACSAACCSPPSTPRASRRSATAPAAPPARPPTHREELEKAQKRPPRRRRRPPSRRRSPQGGQEAEA
jgi:hypothetical protein